MEFTKYQIRKCNELVRHLDEYLLRNEKEIILLFCKEGIKELFKELDIKDKGEIYIETPFSFKYTEKFDDSFRYNWFFSKRQHKKKVETAFIKNLPNCFDIFLKYIEDDYPIRVRCFEIENRLFSVAAISKGYLKVAEPFLSLPHPQFPLSRFFFYKGVCPFHPNRLFASLFLPKEELSKLFGKRWELIRDRTLGDLQYALGDDLADRSQIGRFTSVTNPKLDEAIVPAEVLGHFVLPNWEKIDQLINPDFMPEPDIESEYFRLFPTGLLQVKVNKKYEDLLTVNPNKTYYKFLRYILIKNKDAPGGGIVVDQIEKRLKINNKKVSECISEINEKMKFTLKELFILRKNDKNYRILDFFYKEQNPSKFI